MFKNQNEQALQYLVKTFNIFIHQACEYVNLYSSSCDRSLKELVSIWAHPKGILNLIKNITLKYQNDLSYPQGVGLDQHVVKVEPLPPQDFEKRQASPDIEKSEPRSKSKRIRKNQNRGSTPSQIYQEDQSEESGMKNEQSNFELAEFSLSEEKTYKRGPYKNYTTQEKLEAVEMYYEQMLSITEISKKLGIPCKNIKRWATEGVARKVGGGRRRTNPQLEQQVYKWLVSEYAFGESVSMDLIQEYALSRSADPNFKASRGWAVKFIERYRLKDEYNIV